MIEACIYLAVIALILIAIGLLFLNTFAQLDHERVRKRYEKNRKIHENDFFGQKIKHKTGLKFVDHMPPYTVPSPNRKSDHSKLTRLDNKMVRMHGIMSGAMERWMR